MHDCAFTYEEFVIWTRLSCHETLVLCLFIYSLIVRFFFVRPSFVRQFFKLVCSIQLINPVLPIAGWFYLIASGLEANSPFQEDHANSALAVIYANNVLK